jgi:transcriptional regulator with XRE-family HTH domain
VAKTQEKAPNEGCRLLRASELSLSQIAGIAGISKPAVVKWRSGSGKPDDASRLKLETDTRTRIPRDAWDRAAGTRAAIPPPTPPPIPQVDIPPAPSVGAGWAADPGFTPPPLPPRGPEPPPVAQYARADVDLEAPGAARALVVAQIRRLQADCARLRAACASDDVIRRAEEAERKAYLDLAKLAGELNPTEEARLVKSVKWHAIKGATLKALEPWPDAVQAVADAFLRQEA